MEIFTESQIHCFADGMTHFQEFTARERRRHLRRCAAMNMMCMRPGESGAQSADKCVLVNISKSGIAVESRKIYLNGEKILAVFTARRDGLAVITAEIVRACAGEFGTLYGAKYAETNPKRIREFNAYILKHFNLY
jgi:hypothetical protein